MGDKRLTVRTSADIPAKNSTAAETAKPLLIGHFRGQGYSGHTAEKGHTHIADPQSRGRGETQGCSRSARVTCTVVSRRLLGLRSKVMSICKHVSQPATIYAYRRDAYTRL